MSSPIYNLLFGRARSPKSRKSPKSRRSPRRRSPRRRMQQDESNPCSMRKKTQCGYDPNCHWVKGSGCHRRAGVVSDEDIYEGPVFQRPEDGDLATIAHGFAKRRKSPKSRKSPKRKSPKSRRSPRRSPRKMSPRRRMYQDESNPCSMRQKDQCHYDPNCHWVKNSGCQRKRNVASGAVRFRGPVFQRPGDAHLDSINSYPDVSDASDVSNVSAADTPSSMSTALVLHKFGKGRSRSHRSPKSKLSPRRKIGKRRSQKVITIRRK